MIKIIIATPDIEPLNEFSTGLTRKNTKIVWVQECEDVIKQIKNDKFDLLVVNEMLSDIKGLECIKKVVLEDPFLNTVAISNLSPKDFHENTEGLGILMQIPLSPSADDGKKLLDYLQNIIKMTNHSLKKRTN